MLKVRVVANKPPFISEARFGWRSDTEGSQVVFLDQIVELTGSDTSLEFVETRTHSRVAYLHRLLGGRSHLSIVVRSTAGRFVAAYWCSIGALVAAATAAVFFGGKIIP